MVSSVGLIQIDPESDVSRQRFPLLDVSKYRLLATANKGLDAILFDLSLGVDPDLLAHLGLDWQPVGIPTRLPLAQPPTHRLVAREQILHRPGQSVSGVRHPVGSGRALEKDKSLGTCARIESLLVNRVLLPEITDLRLESRKVGG